MSAARLVLVIVHSIVTRKGLAREPSDRHLVVPVYGESDAEIQVDKLDQRGKGWIVVGQRSCEDWRVGMLLAMVDYLQVSQGTDRRPRILKLVRMQHVVWTRFDE